MLRYHRRRIKLRRDLQRRKTMWNPARNGAHSNAAPHNETIRSVHQAHRIVGAGRIIQGCLPLCTYVLIHTWSARSCVLTYEYIQVCTYVHQCTRTYAPMCGVPVCRDHFQPQQQVGPAPDHRQHCVGLLCTSFNKMTREASPGTCDALAATSVSLEPRVLHTDSKYVTVHTVGSSRLVSLGSWWHCQRAVSHKCEVRDCTYSMYVPSESVCT